MSNPTPAIRFIDSVTGSPVATTSAVDRTGYLRAVEVTVNTPSGWDTAKCVRYNDPDVQLDSNDYGATSGQYRTNTGLGALEIVGVPGDASDVDIVLEFYASTSDAFSGYSWVLLNYLASAPGNTFGLSGYPWISTNSDVFNAADHNEVLNEDDNTGLTLDGCILYRVTCSSCDLGANRFIAATFAQRPGPVSSQYFGGDDSNHTKFLFGTVEDYKGDPISGADIRVGVQ